MWTISNDFRGTGVHIQYDVQRDMIYIHSKDRVNHYAMSYYDFMLHLQNETIERLINTVNNVHRQYLIAGSNNLPYKDGTAQCAEGGAIPPSQHGENEAMATGTEYLSRPFSGPYAQSYTHLRTMLHCLWEDNRIPTDHPSRTVPDVKFNKDARKINPWIRHYFTSEQIDAAHIRAKTQYSGRGRKPGALSQRTIDQMTANDVATTVADVVDLPDVDTTSSTVEQSTPTPSVDQQGVMSQYIKRPEFEQVTGHLRRELGQQGATLIRLQEEIGAEEQVRGEQFALLSNRMDAIEASKPTIVELAKPNVPNVELGQQHRNFPELLIMCSAITIAGLRNNVWLHGEAGTGKSTAGKMVAKALGLKYYSLGALETGLQITGYLDAAGVFQTMTPFYKCWKEGGVIMLDEIDAYTPSALLALNGALVDSVYAFACGMVEKHPDCIIIGSANTVGLGGTSEYTGRMKQDAANRNRWVFLDWGHDDSLEDMLCPNKSWLEYVRKVRENLKRRPQKGVMITMRASIYGESLLRAGCSWERTVKATLRDGMSDAQWEQIA